MPLTVDIKTHAYTRFRIYWEYSGPILSNYLFEARI